MRVVAFSEPGSISVLTQREEVIHQPQQGEVLIKIESVGLNRADSLYREGRYFIKPFAEGTSVGGAISAKRPAYSRLGFEGAGVIEAVADHSSFAVGERVAVTPLQFDVISNGCLAEYGVYAESSLIRTPSSVPPALAGGIWMQYLTAWGGLVLDGGLRQGQTLVVTAASSSVGVACIQLGKSLGATVVATTTSEPKAAQLYDLGADHVINMKNDDYVERIRQITAGKGTDLVFDAVAGPSTRFLVQGAGRGSKIIIQGLLDRRPMDIHAGVLMKRLLTFKGFTLDLLLESPLALAQAVKKITEKLNLGELKPVIAQQFSLDCFAEAFALLESNVHTGKIIVNPRE